jgi:transcription-repair coupling factor (superfamily II helicase)
VAMIADQSAGVRVKPDQKLVFARDWPNPDARLRGTAAILSRMARLAEAESEPATLAG